MEKITISYKILRVSPDTSFRKIKNSYQSLLLRYHPSKPKGRHNKDYFVNLVLSFDLISKIKNNKSDSSKTLNEIYTEWSNIDRAFALEKAEQYLTMKYKDFEKEFLPGYFIIIKALVYLIYLFIVLIALAVPIIEFNSRKISGWGIFCFTVFGTFPLFYAVYKTIVDEKFITHRMLQRLDLRIKLFIFRHQKKNAPNDLFKKLKE